MEDIEKKLETLKRLHGTKREYMWGLVVQCVLLALIISTYIISIIAEDIISLAIVSVFMGIVFFVMLNTTATLVAVKKRIAEETDKVCEQLHEETEKMLMRVFDQIDKEFQERKAMVQKKVEENKVGGKKDSPLDTLPSGVNFKSKKIKTTPKNKK